MPNLTKQATYYTCYMNESYDSITKRDQPWASWRTALFQGLMELAVQSSIASDEC